MDRGRARLSAVARDLRRGWEFHRRRPWVSRIEIDGRGYGGAARPTDDPRLGRFERTFPAAASILDLGCLDGGSTLALARRPERTVTGVDPRADNIERARFVQALIGVANVAFVCHDVETTPLTRLGRFDAVLCVGLLSHLPNPADAIDDLALMTPGVLLWTHCCADDEVTAEVDGLPGRWTHERGPADPFSGLSPVSFWPTRRALLDCLGERFGTVEVVEDEADHPHGPALTMVARQGGGSP